MPTYDYVCSHCGHAFEQFQWVTEPKVDACPGCGAPGLVRLVGAGSPPVVKNGTPKFFGQRPT